MKAIQGLIAQQSEPAALDGLQVLIVDDDPDIRDFVTIVLRYRGAEVKSVASGREALKTLGKEQFDLIISDIGMPHMDGYSLMQQIRQSAPEQGRDIPAIALTAFTAATDRKKAFAAGFQHHLAKPVQLDDLLSSITEVMQP